jgi:NADH-quinone oxidoreductase subunit C
MDRHELLQKLQARFGERITDVELDALEPWIRVAPDDWADVALFLRDECGLNYLSCLTAIDRKDGLEAIYHPERMDAARQGIAVRIRVPYDQPVIPSVEHVWKTADWHEREAWDLVGIRFSGHPGLKRILCAEDWEGHPLRKDYVSPDYYHGIRNNVV